MTPDPGDAVAALLSDVLLGRLSPDMAAVRLCMETAHPRDLQEILQTIRPSAAGQPRLERLLAILDTVPEAHRTVRDVLALVPHDRAPEDPAATLARTAAMFDAAARRSPEASVALISLGSPARLDAATAEVVDLLITRDLVAPHSRVVDFGCGIGRIAAALAGRVAAVHGVDLSRVMVARARERCRLLPNVRIEPTDGRRLAGVASGSTDLVLAVDVLPYAAAGGDDLLRAVVVELARVLKRGGSLAAFNWAYGGDPGGAARTAPAVLTGAGLEVLCCGERPLTTWDGALFLARRPR